MLAEQVCIILILLHLSHFLTAHIRLVFEPDDLLEEVALLRTLAQDQVLSLLLILHERHLLDDVVVETLVDEVLLALLCESDFLSVDRDERIEVSIELVQIAESLLLRTRYLGAQNATKSLRLLLARTSARTDLNNDICVWNIDGRVSDLTEDDAVDLLPVTELRNNVHALKVRDLAADEGNVQALRILLEAEQVVAEDNNFVAARLMQFLQVMTRHILGRVVEVEGLFHAAPLVVG